MPDFNQSLYELVVNNLNEFITTLKNAGYNIGTQHYISAHNLLIALAAQGKLPDKSEELALLLRPLLCSNEKEQDEFPQRFSTWLKSLPKEHSQAATSDISAEIKDIAQENKTARWQFVVLGLLLLLGLLTVTFQDAIQSGIQKQLEKYFPLPAFETQVQISKKPKEKVVQNPVEIIPVTVKTVEVTKRLEPAPEHPLKKYTNFAIAGLGIVLGLIAFWWGRIYLQTHRFLKRHSVLTPPQLQQFFLDKPRPLFALLDFTFTAQQLHKHRHVESNTLNPQATIKQTLAKGGVFTPRYQMLRAVPEYLVLIDRSSFQDQLAASVSNLIQQLITLGLFIDCYYFDEDPRRCYREGETNPQTLEVLLTSYPNHRLLIFADSEHFIDPVHGSVTDWMTEFSQVRQPVLFTFSGLQSFGYKEALLHEAGFMVLPLDDAGFDRLLQHFDEERELTDFLKADENSVGLFSYPRLVRQRAQRFLERHTPNQDMTDRLLKDLQGYLGDDGLKWLAACAVYPQLESQLTLHLGYALLGEDNFDQSLFIRLLRLPWFRYGFMPDWLRWLLLVGLSEAEDAAIRVVIYQLLFTASAQQEGNSFKLEVAKDGEVLHWAKRALKFWQRRVAKESELKDFVFQSFLQGKLAVQAPERFAHQIENKYWYGLAAGLVVSVAAALWVFFHQDVQPQPSYVKEKVAIQMNMVSLNGGCFQMGSPETEKDRDTDEKQHQACVDDFQIGQTEVTQKLWQAVMGNNPSSFKGDDLPVESVSWNEVQEFIKKLNQLTGKNYRLPTEAEWEYAARAGTTTAYYWGNSAIHDYANYGKEQCCDGLVEGKDKWFNTSPVGSFSPNPWGVYDMAGNVMEWTCSDYNENYDGTEIRCNTDNNTSSNRVLRGGSWINDGRVVRSANRYWYSPGYRIFNLGFRLALGLPGKASKQDASRQNQAGASRSSDSAILARSALAARVLAPDMMPIPQGCFMMGSPESEKERNPDEKQHKVCVTYFQLAQYEITIEQYMQCVTDGGCNPPEWLEKGSDYNINTGSSRDVYASAGMSLANKGYPVTGVSWSDALAYTQWLSEKTGKNYRLPTEAEWEYAVRAGIGRPFYTGNCISFAQANYNGNYPYSDCAKGEYKQQTVKVGSYPANSWQLYDMAGNVWEWTCSDYNENYDGTETRCSTNSSYERVLRGGSWYGNGRDVRSAIRYGFTPDDRSNDIGFRLALGQ